MQRLFICLCAVLSLAFAHTLHAQRNEGDTTLVTIRKDQLTQQQLQQLEAQTLNQKIQAYGKWVGMGREVGEAVNSSLSAITEQANKFSQTGVGRLTVTLVVWKVIGDQAIHLAAGLLLLAVGLAIWVPSYRRCSKRVDLYDARNVEKANGMYSDELTQLDKERLVHLCVLVAIVVFATITIFSY